MSHGLSANGIDTFVSNIVKGLDKCKYDITVVIAVDEDNTQLREAEVCAAGAKVFRTCDLGSIKRMWVHSKKLLQLLKTNKPDIFHSNMDLLNGLNLLVAWLAGVPIRVSHSHTTSSQYEKKTGKHLIVSIYRGLMKILCTMFSNRRCGCSEAAMKYLYGKRWQNKKHCCLVSNGIDTSRFTVSERPSHMDGEWMIVTVGRISPVKNPLFAISIIEALYQIRQDFKYLWVGNGELIGEVQSIIAEKRLQTCVNLLGARGDVDKILSHCHVFLLPSLFEGLPISLIEAQAAGLPCVISDTITREIDCGGCCFESLEMPASHWAQVISDLLDGKYSYEIDVQKLERFDTSYTVKQLDAIYED